MMQVSEPCSFSDTCSPVGSSRCHGMFSLVLSFSLPPAPLYSQTHSRPRTTGTPPNRNQSVVSIASSPLSLIFPASLRTFHTFFKNIRLTGAWAWRNHRLIRRVLVLQHISHQFPHTTPSERPFIKHGRNRGRCRGRCCGDHNCHCLVLLSATTAFASAVCRDGFGRRWCVPGAHG
jgi:hypothetical protein